MTIIPLYAAVHGTCINSLTKQVFDVHVAHSIAQRRLRQEVKSHLTGVLSGIVSPGKSHPASWKFAFKDTQVVGAGDGRRVVIVHEKYSSESKEALDDFNGHSNAFQPAANHRIAEIPPLPAARPTDAPYQLELVGSHGHKPKWVVHVIKNGN